MAKFTVFFKDKPIHSVLFETGVIHIGRDDTNDIILDSLAVAPAHAVVVIRENDNLIKQLNNSFPLTVNNETRKECSLFNGDRITIGKHSIAFSTTESVAENIQPNNTPVYKGYDALNQEIETNANESEAGLQVMDGAHIGRVIPLKKAMTRLGHNDNGIVVITRRKDGYFISALEHNPSLTVNRKQLDDTSVKLSSNDHVVIDNIPMRFFLD